MIQYDLCHKLTSRCRTILSCQETHMAILKHEYLQFESNYLEDSLVTTQDIKLVAPTELENLTITLYSVITTQCSHWI